MTIEEAIDHAREASQNGCSECAKEHGQLADWLTELQTIRRVIGDDCDLHQLQQLLLYCSGKTPDQVKMIFDEWSYYLNFAGKRNAIENAVDEIYDDGRIDYDRLRELVTADREGRCVFFLPGYPVVTQYFPADEDGLYTKQVVGVISEEEYQSLK